MALKDKYINPLQRVAIEAITQTTGLSKKKSKTYEHSKLLMPYYSPLTPN